jgi:hypothetical protein
MNIYLDTNLWNALCDQGVEPGRLLESLSARGSRLVLSHQTVFELAKTFVKAPERGKHLFSYVNEFVLGDAMCTKEITGVLEAEMGALQSPTLGIRPFLPAENYCEFKRDLVGLASGDFGDQANRFVKERIELGIAERSGPGSCLEKRPHIRQSLRSVLPSQLEPWMARETTTAQGLMLLAQQIIRQFGGVPTHDEAVTWAFWLISSPACRLAQSLVRHDLYYNWRYAHNGSIPKDLYPDMYHVLNATYCDVYATKEPGQQNYAELLLTSRTKVAIYEGQSSLDRWLEDLT